MPRKARITIAGVVHHIMSRGIDGRNIFIDENDRNRFLDLLSRGIHKSGYQCYAWVLMNTHYHLLIRTSGFALSSFMRWLNSTYSRYYNARHKRRGYLFQDRYKSIATQDQNYLEEILRYIHLNPVRAGTCKTISGLDRYPWSGHAVLMGFRKNGFQNTKDVLNRFDKSVIKARVKYRTLLEQALRSKDADNIVETIRKSNEGKTDIHHTGSWVIGDSCFVKDVLAKDKENRSRIAKYLKEGVELDDVLKLVSRRCRLLPEKIKRRSRGGEASNARKLFVYVSREIYGFKVAAIGRYLGISGPAASISLRGGEKLIKKRESLFYY